MTDVDMLQLPFQMPTPSLVCAFALMCGILAGYGIITYHWYAFPKSYFEARLQTPDPAATGLRLLIHFVVDVAMLAALAFAVEFEIIANGS